MPIKVLFITNNESLKSSIHEILKKNLGIKYLIINDLELLNPEIKDNNYSHVISSNKINNTFLKNYLSGITVPILALINDADTETIENTLFKTTKLPLTYSTLFSFLCETPILAYGTLESYALDDPEFITQVKGLIVEEFENNFKEIPQLIKNNNLTEIKSKTHQMVSKFALLEMNNSFELSKEIDLNILDEPEKQLQNMAYLLVDIEIALTQLK
ncbi:MAG: hypothetical protein GQ540_00310 [Lutibacter sp.]|uniref:hypothetical protein n=1 Tax=Lutibacter sp. TaxID=1925666 RepID=UPI0019E4ECD8|nr:hypothetical protein [Lutibacter sp.]NOR26952.1 hypothetical protein [Lutibacter sp.]